MVYRLGTSWEPVTILGWEGPTPQGERVSQMHGGGARSAWADEGRQILVVERPLQAWTDHGENYNVIRLCRGRVVYKSKENHQRQ